MERDQNSNKVGRPVRTILVTGGCGFIGSALIRNLIRRTEDIVINVDRMTYAASSEALEDCSQSPRYHFVNADIADEKRLKKIFESFGPHGVINLAAETHVDRSIDSPSEFIRTNVVGTYVLLEVARWYFSSLSGERKSLFRVHHVSTDEVYGSLMEDQPAFCEATAYQPQSPYAASKAAADHLVLAWYRTYGLPVVITNSSNNYGPWQFPEKLVPLTIVRALNEQPLLLYGSGCHTRDWLFVEDHAEALISVFDQGRKGEKYNTATGVQLHNIQVMEAICSILDELHPLSSGRSYKSLIRFVPDRPGHDHQYAMNCQKIFNEVGWSAQVAFEAGLRHTIEWYLRNQNWWRNILLTKYDGRRLGSVG